jgi:hydrogenase expression/formation protein HypC
MMVAFLLARRISRVSPSGFERKKRMCLAIPARVIELLPDDMAKVSLDGVIKTVSLGLVEDVAVEDYVIVHVGYALAKIDPMEAEHTLALLREAALVSSVEEGR